MTEAQAAVTPSKPRTPRTATTTRNKEKARKRHPPTLPLTASPHPQVPGRRHRSPAELQTHHKPPSGRLPFHPQASCAWPRQVCLRDTLRVRAAKYSGVSLRSQRSPRTPPRTQRQRTLGLCSGLSSSTSLLSRLGLFQKHTDYF